MPSLIEDYIQQLLNVIASSPIIAASNVILDKRTNRSGLIRGDLTFLNGSHLHFRELVDIQENVIRLMYSYHYQRSDNRLIFCYDDTPHHLELSGFPHHKHIGKEADVISSAPPSIAEILAEIERNFPLSK